MRTLDDIVPPSRRKSAPTDLDDREPAPLRARARGRFPYGTALIAAIVIIGVGAVLWYYSGASVTVTPNATSLSASGTYTASISGNALSYQIITADKIATQSVQSSGTKAVSSSASGTITIKNSQSTVQKLITNTRFSTSAGLIFRIHAAVSIPANGSAQATVYADQPGSTYNVGPSSFTIPGFANTPQFTLVTAQSAGSMSGGASGNQPVVDSSVAASTRASLQTALAPDLATELAAKVPQGYVLLPGASNTSYQDLDAVPSGTTGMVDVREEGTVTAVVMPNAALASALAAQIEGSSYTGEPVTIVDPSTLTLSPSSGFPTASSQSFTFTLAGTAKLLSTIDPNQIASAVAGKTRTAAEVALTNYPSVKQAVLVLRPFWASAFPEDPAKIKVTVGKPQ